LSRFRQVINLLAHFELMKGKNLYIRLCFLFVFVGCSEKLIASNDHYPAGAREAALANSAVTINDIWAVFHNQAALAGMKNPAIGFYHERRFMMSQLSYQAISLALPVKGGVFAACYSSFGYSLYRETNAGLAYAKRLANRFSAGIQIDYLHTYIAQEYGRSGTMTVEGGLIAEPFPNFLIGAHVFNPFRQSVSKQDEEKIPTVFTMGCSYTFFNKVLIAVETEKDMIHKAVFRSGVEFELAEKFLLRTGISTQPVFYSFGLGYSFKKIMIDIALTRHQILGYTPHFSMSYTF